MESITQFRVVDSKDGGGASYEYLNLGDAVESLLRRSAQWPEDGPQKIQTREMVYTDWQDLPASVVGKELR